MQSLTSEQLFERALKVAPGGVHSPVRSFKGLDRGPVFFKKAHGAYLTSVENKEYIDFCQSFGPMILGHLDEEVREVVHQMVDTAWTFGAAEIYSLELAEWITGTLPFMEKIRFVSSGTEAVMSALRLARAATGRNKVLKFEGCYHGHVDNLLVKAGSGLAGEAASSSAGVPAEVAATTIVAPLNNVSALEEIFQVHGKDIAAIIIEPLPANYGLLVQTQEFLQSVANIAKRHGSLLIFDEVISGFRVGLGGMVEKTGITPDLVTYGKIIGGGFPVGCYGGRADLMNRVAPSGDVYQAGTLSANPIGMCAGLTTLKKMQRVDGWNVLADRTAKFAKKLEAGFQAKSLDLQVTSHSSLFWIHGKSEKTIRNIDEIPSNQGPRFKNLFLKSLERGVYLAPNAYEVGFISLAHTDEILDQAAEAIIASAE
ncbi:glutamate-1-semialdehyde aminotransferase [Bdellovibrio bacteriovorus W]|nr:glutamate-1-semialdehyde aminotransferase [Bdellovibrio bacteriovorus W]